MDCRKVNFNVVFCYDLLYNILNLITAISLLVNEIKRCIVLVNREI